MGSDLCQYPIMLTKFLWLPIRCTNEISLRNCSFSSTSPLSEREVVKQQVKKKEFGSLHLWSLSLPNYRKVSNTDKNEIVNWTVIVTNQTSNSLILPKFKLILTVFVTYEPNSIFVKRTSYFYSESLFLRQIVWVCVCVDQGFHSCKFHAKKKEKKAIGKDNHELRFKKVNFELHS